MLSLYNTLSRKKEKFKPIRNTVAYYSCGPTVYDRVHIGNLRTFIFEDILRRTLRYNGYRIWQVMNITDIEDKIINRFKREKRRDIAEITRPYTKYFFEDIKKLNIEKAESHPLVTKNIKEIIKLIQKLINKKIAYQSEDDSIYFDISKFKKYGELSHLPKGKLKPAPRVSTDEYGKGETADFVLWKARRTGEPFWQSPFGEGRPGWHIECSALSMKYLSGERSRAIDIHAGGVDLIFPHHENEIAQSEAATGKKFVNYWVHGEHLLVNGKKMAKSLGNFYTLEDLEKKGFNPLSFRYFVLNAHYRSKLNFTWKGISAAQKGFHALYHEVARLNFEAKFQIPNLKSQDLQIVAYKDAFFDVINDDLNTPKALALIWDLIRDKEIWPSNKVVLLLDFDQVLGLKLKEAIKLSRPPAKTASLVKEREKHRANKQFVQADRLRKRIEGLGYTVEDTPQGPFVWPRKI